MQDTVVLVYDLVRRDVAGERVRAVEAFCEAEDGPVLVVRHARFSVPVHHHAIDEAQLVEEIYSEVPVNAEEGISSHIDAYRTPSHGDRPKHRHHVRAAQTECHEIRVGDWGGGHIGLIQVMHAVFHRWLSFSDSRNCFPSGRSKIPYEFLADHTSTGEFAGMSVCSDGPVIAVVSTAMTTMRE
ncbi:hypothetical protein GCM10020216_031620 [Nonomuraea helvata]